MSEQVAIAVQPEKQENSLARLDNLELTIQTMKSMKTIV